MNYIVHLINKFISRTSFLLILANVFIAISVNAAVPDSVGIKITPPSISFFVSPVSGVVEDENGMRAGLLYDVDRKAIVWQKDMNYAYPVASLTKMMVGLLAIEDIKAGKADWKDEVTVSREYYKGKGRHKRRYSTQVVYTLEDLIKLAMINSNNEATVWIGKKLAGGELEPFIRRMNEKCQALGMEHTFFSNPSGLPAVSGEYDNSSSPNDLLILALELIKYQEILDITKIDFVTIHTNKGNQTYRNHNGLVIQYQNEVDGLKTGYTKNARFCLVATANHGGHRLISIVLGARNPYARNLIVADMMNNYYGLLGLAHLGEQISDTNMARQVADSLERNPATANSITNDTNDSSSLAYRKVYIKSKKTHLVRKGETLFAIADKYDCNASEIKKWNRLKSSHLKSGQRLLIYQRIEKTMAIRPGNPDSSVVDDVISKSATVSVNTVHKSKNKTTANHNELLKGKIVYHIVQPGDTLWNIAQRYSGTTVDAIKKVNKINNSKSLRPGTKLKIRVNS